MATSIAPTRTQYRNKQRNSPEALEDARIIPEDQCCPECGSQTFEVHHQTVLKATRLCPEETRVWHLCTGQHCGEAWEPRG